MTGIKSSIGKIEVYLLENSAALFTWKCFPIPIEFRVAQLSETSYKGKHFFEKYNLRLTFSISYDKIVIIVTILRCIYP